MPPSRPPVLFTSSDQAPAPLMRALGRRRAPMRQLMPIGHGIRPPADGAQTRSAQGVHPHGRPRLAQSPITSGATTAGGSRTARLSQPFDRPCAAVPGPRSVIVGRRAQAVFFPAASAGQRQVVAAGRAVDPTVPAGGERSHRSAAGRGPGRVGGHPLRPDHGCHVAVAAAGAGLRIRGDLLAAAWQQAGVWDGLHQQVLDALGEQGLLDWSRTVIDSVAARAKRGRADRPQPGRPGQARHQVPPAGRASSRAGWRR